MWTGPQYRPTRDTDFLARGENSPERFSRIFRELCSEETELDGLRFDPNTVAAERIAEDADYEGVRVSFTAYLERAKIPIQIDIGFGDAVTPPPVEHNYPTLLGATAPRLLTYPRETVVAETHTSEGAVLQMAGAVAVILQMPVNTTGEYQVRFPDGAESSLKRTEFQVRKELARTIGTAMSSD